MKPNKHATDPLILYIRTHIYNSMYLARHATGTYRRNLVTDAMGWNKLLVRRLREAARTTGRATP